ncbi:MAG: hypothetical protein ACTSW1_04395 [Candidatus Hodarchaeales archaeon]
MIINAERMRIEKDEDNNLWIINFRDEERSIRGRIEIPSKIVDMEDIKEFSLEITPRNEGTVSRDLSNSLITFNAKSYRTKPVGDEIIYSFSAGGLMTRVYSTSEIKELKPVLKDFLVIISKPK